LLFANIIAKITVSEKFVGIMAHEAAVKFGLAPAQDHILSQALRGKRTHSNIAIEAGAALVILFMRRKSQWPRKL